VVNTRPLQLRFGFTAVPLFVAAFSTPTYAAECPKSFTALQFEDQLGAAESALSSLDLPLFTSNMSSADRMIPCLNEHIIPSLAATYHRFYGLRAFGQRDTMAEKAFAAARYLEPGYEFSHSLLPEGNPIRNAFENVSFEDRAVDALEPAAGGSIYIDGNRSLKRPNEWPTLVQWVESGDIRFSEYLLPGTPFPTYTLASDVVIPARDPSIPLLAASGGAAILSGALYSIALINKGRYNEVDENPVSDKDLAGLRRTTNSMVVVSGISAAAAVGSGVVVVATW
jgi:hypothetical protein